jgi:hypothetical protein
MTTRARAAGPFSTELSGSRSDSPLCWRSRFCTFYCSDIFESAILQQPMNCAWMRTALASYQGLNEHFDQGHKSHGHDHASYHRNRCSSARRRWLLRARTLVVGQSGFYQPAAIGSKFSITLRRRLLSGSGPIGSCDRRARLPTAGSRRVRPISAHHRHAATCQGCKRLAFVNLRIIEPGARSCRGVFVVQQPNVSLGGNRQG